MYKKKKKCNKLNQLDLYHQRSGMIRGDVGLGIIRSLPVAITAEFPIVFTCWILYEFLLQDSLSSLSL